MGHLLTWKGGFIFQYHIKYHGCRDYLMYNWNLGPDLLLCVSVFTKLCLHKNFSYKPFQEPLYSIKSSHQISDSEGEKNSIFSMPGNWAWILSFISGSPIVLMSQLFLWFLWCKSGSVCAWSFPKTSWDCCRGVRNRLWGGVEGCEDSVFVLLSRKIVHSFPLDYQGVFWTCEQEGLLSISLLFLLFEVVLGWRAALCGFQIHRRPP